MARGRLGEPPNLVERRTGWSRRIGRRGRTEEKGRGTWGNKEGIKAWGMESIIEPSTPSRTPSTPSVEPHHEGPQRTNAAPRRERAVRPRNQNEPCCYATVRTNAHAHGPRWKKNPSNRLLMLLRCAQPAPLYHQQRTNERTKPVVYTPPSHTNERHNVQRSTKPP